MKQTAVHELFLKWLHKDLTTEDFEQAKEMEKEQIIEASKSCNYIGGATNIEAEQYYNETYGTDA
jgi:Zn-dependent peptidase ImmA (M78 family)